MAKILIVEDDRALSNSLKDFLLVDNHVVEVLEDGREALEHLKFYKYELIILDVQLPGLTGYEICRAFRGFGGNTVVLMLTARGSIDDKEQGFAIGADDYLVKPFHPRELIARVKALLRRGEPVMGAIQLGDVVVEPELARVSRNDIEIRLLPKEFALLNFLIRHPNQVFSCEALMERVWETDSDASPETIRVHIMNLRKKIENAGTKLFIKTVHGMGYKLELAS